jgi:hypothetical protein
MIVDFFRAAVFESLGVIEIGDTLTMLQECYFLLGFPLTRLMQVRMDIWALLGVMRRVTGTNSTSGLFFDFQHPYSSKDLNDLESASRALLPTFASD